MKRQEEAGFRLKRSKCNMISLITYLGHKIDVQGQHPLPQKVTAINIHKCHFDSTKPLHDSIM